MSLALNTLIGFFGLGATSVASFLVVNSHKQVPIQLPPPAFIGNTFVKKSIQKLKEAGYRGCANLTNGIKGTSFYVCIKEESNGSHNPHFYYHDKSNGNSFPQIKQIKKTSKSWESQLITDKGSTTVTSYYLPFWLRNLNNSDGKLDNVCQVIGEKGKSTSFVLKCNGGREVQKGIQI